MTTREEILAHCIRAQGDWTEIALAVRDHVPFIPAECPESYVTILDPDYPNCFRKLRYPPWILFWRGNLKMLDRPAALITGSRDCTARGLADTSDVTEILRRKYVIAAGLGEGAEAQAHRAALCSGTIGIAACGIDRYYPGSSGWIFRRLARDHLLISEYPPGVPAKPQHFPWRARLLAAAAEFAVITETDLCDGVSHIVEACLELNRSVFCLPADYSRKEHIGCNQLISEGAGILFSPQTVRDL